MVVKVISTGFFSGKPVLEETDCEQKYEVADAWRQPVPRTISGWNWAGRNGDSLDPERVSEAEEIEAL
jgi:hypothetical protein